jgi:hypothetical protein
MLINAGGVTGHGGDGTIGSHLQPDANRAASLALASQTWEPQVAF